MASSNSGSPVGTFTQTFSVVLATGANQQVIAAPGVGLAIYIQTLNYSSANGAVAWFAEFHAAGGNIFSSHVSSTAAWGDQHTFPGGFRLPDNTALQVDINPAAAVVRVAGTYIIGPTI